MFEISNDEQRARIDSEGGAYSLAEICVRLRISRTWLYELRAKGQGPDEIRIGRRVYVTKQAAETWERTMIERIRAMHAARGDHDVERDHHEEGNGTT
jgi:predicted DNA-binding transcriptional regulator AlpA